MYMYRWLICEANYMCIYSHKFTPVIFTMSHLHVCVFLQTWHVKTGDSLAVINGSGLGVKPVMFFHDSIRLASAQEKGVLVS